jgi:hypothetical protein
MKRAETCGLGKKSAKLLMMTLAFCSAYYLMGDFSIFSCTYLTLLHLPPLRFDCVGGY